MAKRLDQQTQLTAAQLAQNDIIGIRDMSAGQTKYITVKDLTGSPEFGWQATGESHTFSSWDAATRIGVITVPSDATTKYQPGNRYRFTQATGGTKYAIIHAVTATTLTLFLPTGTTLNNEAITSPVYSPLDTPYGFNKDTDLWSIIVNPVANTGNTPAKSTYYRPSSTGVLTYGVGKWLIDYQASVRVAGSGSSWASQYTTLSTTTNSETIADTSVYSGGDQATGGVLTFSMPHWKSDILRTVTSGTETLNLLHMVDVQGTVMSSCGLNAKSRMVATSAYL